MFPDLPLTFLVYFSLFHSINCESSTKIGRGYCLISTEISYGRLAGLIRVKEKNTIYGPDIPYLNLLVKHETEDRLRVHITDAKKQRWEVPYYLLPRQEPRLLINQSWKTTLDACLRSPGQLFGSKLLFSYITDPFSFAVIRKSNGNVLFNSSSEEADPFGEMVFKDQYLEISTRLPVDASLYGLGENTQPHGIKLRSGEPYTLYATDLSAIKLNTDLYGSHPVYMDLRKVNGKAFAHGVLLLSSNGMDVLYRNTSLTYKVIGGVLDFYFFSGPTPLDVTNQYTKLIGRPAAVPYWAFGFHQCRWGYQNITVVEDVVKNYREHQIPLDVIWNDDDHMDGHKDFTLNPDSYPHARLLKFINKMHKIGMKYIVLIDPGISVNESYSVYQRGIASDVFIKYQGKPYVAQVWPGAVNFPDFLNPKTVEWWCDEIHRFHELVPVNGLWIDMNEASNFCSGLCEIPKGKDCPEVSGSAWECCLDCKNITKTKWDDPPYKINASGLHVPIGYKTIATSAVHYNGILEYDAHSLYGFSQSIATYKALQKLEGKRPFVLSRSTYVGSGKYAAHWTGDNKGTWEDLRYSISTMLNFGIFGVPMVGSDICGFYPAPTEELCNRWIELGAFYPFSRDHANKYSPRQELYQWKSVARSARNALGMRYKLLPYLYTLNYEAHIRGAPIARPLFFSFPNCADCYWLSTQFLIGKSLLVSPVLEEGKTVVKALFPRGTWYNIFHMRQAIISEKDQYLFLNASINEINVHLYQNTILPMQKGGLTSKEARNTHFSLVVAFPAGEYNGDAKGSIFLDDDEQPRMSLRNGHSTFIDLHATVSNGTVRVWSEVKEGKFAWMNELLIKNITVLGLEQGSKVFKLEVDGRSMASTSISLSSVEDRHDNKLMMVKIIDLNVPLVKSFNLTLKRRMSA